MLNCPVCNGTRFTVMNTITTVPGVVRRRRMCKNRACRATFTTCETVSDKPRITYPRLHARGGDVERRLEAPGAVSRTSSLPNMRGR